MWDDAVAQLVAGLPSVHYALGLTPCITLVGNTCLHVCNFGTSEGGGRRIRNSRSSLHYIASLVQPGIN